MRGLFGRSEEQCDRGACALGLALLMRAASAAGVIVDRVDVMNTRGWAKNKAEYLKQIVDSSIAGGPQASFVYGTIKSFLKSHQVAGALGDRGAAVAGWAVDYVLSGRGAVMADWAVSVVAAALSKAGYQVPAIEWCERVTVDPLRHPSLVSSSWEKRCREMHFHLEVKNSFYQAVEDPDSDDNKSIKRSLSWGDYPMPRPAKRSAKEGRQRSSRSSAAADGGTGAAPIQDAPTPRLDDRGAADSADQTQGDELMSLQNTADVDQGMLCRGEAMSSQTTAMSRQSTESEQAFDMAHAASFPSTMSAGDWQRNSTVILRTVPRELTRAGLLDHLVSCGFGGRFNFVYLPMDFTLRQCIGYALIGLQEHEDGERLIAQLPDFEPTWSSPAATLEEHIDRYRNSPVMHQNMPDEYKPAIFSQGVRVPFPAPTRSIRAPRIRHAKPPPREAWRQSPRPS